MPPPRPLQGRQTLRNSKYFLSTCTLLAFSAAAAPSDEPSSDELSSDVPTASADVPIACHTQAITEGAVAAARCKHGAATPEGNIILRTLLVSSAATTPPDVPTAPSADGACHTHSATQTTSVAGRGRQHPCLPHTIRPPDHLCCKQRAAAPEHACISLSSSGLLRRNCYDAALWRGHGQVNFNIEPSSAASAAAEASAAAMVAAETAAAEAEKAHQQ